MSRTVWSACVAAVVALSTQPSGVHAAPSPLTQELMNLEDFPHSRCNDGSPSGYYVNSEANPDTDTFVIFLEGGGACFDKETCLSRAKTHLGSSTHWPKTQTENSVFFDSDCSVNPRFCTGTQVFIPYCTSDTHYGGRLTASEETFNLYFSGRLSFESIIEHLVQEHGLGNATHVLLAGGSAGGVGTFHNIDWLAQRLPSATIKGAPNAGWFFPQSLPSDFPGHQYYPPSNWANFNQGTHGGEVNMSAYITQLWNTTLHKECVENIKPSSDSIVCGSVSAFYPYIKAPIYTMEAQYDTNQLFTQQGVPRNYSNPKVLDYIRMQGECMRNSTLESVIKEGDGIYLSSCLEHAVSEDRNISGVSWPSIVSDWFWETGNMTSYYALRESCQESADGLPCNPAAGCQVPGPGPAPSGGCRTELEKLGCLKQSTGPDEGLNNCEKCAEAHREVLEKAGCTVKAVEQLCTDAMAEALTSSF